MSLKKKTQLDKKERKDLAHFLVHYAESSKAGLGVKSLRKIAQGIDRLYPNAIKDLVAGSVVGNGIESFVRIMKNKVENSRRKSNTFTKAQKRGLELTRSPVKSHSDYSKDSYGCIDFQPVISDKDCATLETNRQEMLIDNFSPVEAVGLMTSTFPLLRKEINAGTSLKNIKARWPHLLQDNGIFNHFKMLTGNYIYSFN